jgi:hypothetical protein
LNNATITSNSHGTTLGLSIGFLAIVAFVLGFVVYRKKRKSSPFNDVEGQSLTSRSSSGKLSSRMLPQHTKTTGSDVDVGFPITSNCLNTEYEIADGSI